MLPKSTFGVLLQVVAHNVDVWFNTILLHNKEDSYKICPRMQHLER